MNSPKYLIAGNQTEARTGVPNKANSIALFEHMFCSYFTCFETVL